MSEIPGQGEFDFKDDQSKIPTRTEQAWTAAEREQKLVRPGSKPLVGPVPHPGPSEARQEETSYVDRRSQHQINKAGLKLARDTYEKARRRQAEDKTDTDQTRATINHFCLSPQM